MNTVSMHLTRNKARAQFLKIELMWTDTYTMTFSKATGKKYHEKLEIIKVIEGVYNDMLQDVFIEVTGLNTSL